MLSDITDELNQTIGVVTELQNKKIGFSIIERGKQVQYEEFDSSTASLGTAIEKFRSNLPYGLNLSDICVVTDNEKIKDGPIKVHGTKILEGLKTTDKIQALTYYYVKELNSNIISVQYEQQQGMLKCLICHKDKKDQSQYTVRPIKIQNIIADIQSQKTYQEILLQHNNTPNYQKYKLQCLTSLVNNLMILFQDYVILLIGDIQQVDILNSNVVKADENNIIEGTHRWLVMQTKDLKSSGDYQSMLQSPPEQMFSSYFIDREGNDSRTLKNDLTQNINKHQGSKLNLAESNNQQQQNQ